MNTISYLKEISFLKKPLGGFLILTELFLFISCSSVDNFSNDSIASNKVLLLKVDYLTHTFECGKETTFSTLTPSFTISTLYEEPMDFGNITLKYQELNEILFSGDIVWNGNGHILFPENINMYSANYFETVNTNDIVYPIGIENIFNPYNQNYNYSPIWLAIQNLTKVREYLLSNPNTTVKLFLYTPSIGIGNPANYDWIIILKN